MTNARGIQGDIIADFAIAGVTMLHWNFRRLLHEQAERKWIPRNLALLADKTLGVIGFGSIGATIARRAKSAGMTVVGSKRYISVPVDGVDRLFAFNALEDWLPLSDFVVLAVPAHRRRSVLCAPEIACMKPHAF